MNNRRVARVSAFLPIFLFIAGVVSPPTATAAQITGFTATGNMTMPRETQAAALLSNGSVLIAGGAIANQDGSSTPESSAELYNPDHGTFSATGSMTAARQNAIGITLPGGKVFVTDGITADLYDPKSATFSATTSPNFANSPIRALLLKTRKVLLTDGTTAKLFDPSNGAIAPTGSLKVTRTEFTATLLNNGKVLVAGGCCDSNGALSSAELYDPSSGMFALTGSMTHPRFNHVAAVVGGSKAKGGDALIVGGSAFTPPPGGPNLDVAGADLYNPATGKFSFIAPDPSTNQPRYGFGATATTLSDGRVLIAGGEDTNDGGGAFDLPTLYDPSTGTFANAGNMVNPRDFHSATLLKNGQVLIAGGDNGSFPHPGCCSTLSGAELFSSHRHKGH